MLTRSTPRFDTEPGFAVGIVVTTPPFPYYRDMVPVPVGLPILFDGDLSPAERRHLHYGEVAFAERSVGHKRDERLHARRHRHGRDQWRPHATPRTCLADKVLVPNGRYRRDIGTRLIEGDFAQLEAWGLLDT